MSAGSGAFGLDVVVPAHDAETTLPACLDGLRRAGFAPEEVVVVSDGSRDTTAQIAARFGARVCRTEAPVGAAAARNIGVASCSAPFVLFVDADVALHAGVRERVLDFLARHPDHAGVIGSYDDAPPAPGGVSRIRNLLHHHVHQQAAGDLPSFWAGCGALRRSDFAAVGGFPPGHRLEDVALGQGLAAIGRPVRLDPEMQGTHLKRWTWRSMVRADLFYRALPWSRMMLDPESPGAGMLNADRAGKVSVVLAGLAALCMAGVPVAPRSALVGVLATLGALALQNRRFLRLVRRKLCLPAALQALGVLWVHFLCAGAGFAWALGERLSARVRRWRGRPPPCSPSDA